MPLDHLRRAVVVLLMLGALQACGSQQTYSAGVGWQKQACNRLNDPDERRRCMASSDMSYEQYKREAEAAKGSK
jgi:hypothetical protein